MIPGLLLSARLYAPQIEALWRSAPVMIANHTRDDSMAAHRRGASWPRRRRASRSSDCRWAATSPSRSCARRRSGSRGSHCWIPWRARTPRRRALRAARRWTSPRAGASRRWSTALIPRLVHASRLADAQLRDAHRGDGRGGRRRRLRPAADGQHRAHRFTPDLKDIRCPTLVLVGDSDQLTPPGARQRDRRRHRRRAPGDRAAVRPSVHPGAPAGGERGPAGRGCRASRACHGLRERATARCSFLIRTRPLRAPRLRLRCASQRRAYWFATIRCTRTCAACACQTRMAAAHAMTLWRHTCFEAFVTAADACGLLRVQLLARTRLGGVPLRGLPARHDRRRCWSPPRACRCMQDPRDWSCPRRSHLAGLADLTAAARLRVALAAVIEDDDGRAVVLVACSTRRASPISTTLTGLRWS